MITISFFRLYPLRRIFSLFPPDHYAHEPVETLIVTSGLRQHGQGRLSAPGGLVVIPLSRQLTATATAIFTC